MEQGGQKSGQTEKDAQKYLVLFMALINFQSVCKAADAPALTFILFLGQL